MGQQHNYLKRTLTACLCLLLLPGSGCGKKKEKRADEVLSCDPYFDAEIHELKIPTDETKEIRNLLFDSVSFSGKQIRIVYDLSYVPPKKYDIISEGHIYNRAGTAVFDLKGNMLSNENTSLRTSDAASATSYDKDGNLAELHERYGSGGRTFQIRIIDSGGQEIRKVDLKAPAELREKYFWDFKCLPDGGFLLEGPDATRELAEFAFDASGKYLFTISPQERNIRSSVFLYEGKPYVLTGAMGSLSSLEVNEIDMTNGAIKKGQPIKAGMELSGIQEGEDGVYFTTGNGISRLDITTGEAEEILNWNQTDVNREMIQMAKSYPVNKDEINVLVTYSYSETGRDTCYIIHLTRASTNPHAGKKILRMAGTGIRPEIYGLIYEYNADRNNPARIETVDYLIDYDSDNTSGLSVTDKIYLDMMEGNSPDILLSFGEMEKFANADLLLDLNPYVDGELGLTRSEYFDNIFRACEINGKLYAAPLCFWLSGYLADMDRLDIKRNWTLKDLEKVSGSLPPDALLMPPSECLELLWRYMGYDLSPYMDSKTKDVKFSCDEMMRIMSIAKKYGQVEEGTEVPLPSSRALLIEPDYRGVYGYTLKNDEPGPFEEDMYRDRKYALIPYYMGSLSEYAFFSSLSGDAYRLVGSPTSHGTGVTASVPYAMAITKSTKYPKEAWEVVRGFFTENAQKTLLGKMSVESASFPIRKSVFQEENEDVVKRIGRAYEAWKEDRLENASGMQDYIYFPARDGIAEELFEIAEDVQFVIHVDDDIADVIDEEASGYFAGSRSAEDVLQNIDRRVRQIVQER